ncbi:5-exo-hydroxycamphor dehydrogenase [Penicillium brasilianum]|uniref:5-exo-hydroxycamphor dehydrogenase n=1 Tax=Penicillium brasilianum TaxID=104259 RepID=A0A1S9RW85_PENBI|nr:5-exo-hydroxycamphor dehydrogenase [Penicillium brasilianum]
MRQIHSMAAVIPAKDHPIEFWESEIPLPPVGGINVEVQMAGVCGTDLHIWKGDISMPFAQVLGHEGVGKILELGEGVTRDHADQPIAAGDLVYWCPMRPCHACYSCVVRRDYPSCENGGAFTDAREPTAASYTRVATLPKTVSFFKFDPMCPAEAVIALGCALPAVLQGVEHIGGIPLNSTVVVQGAGPIGLAAVMVASLASARRIIVIEGQPARLEMAQRFGATDTINLQEVKTVAERQKRVQEITAAPGVDIVIEATGRLGAFDEGLGLLQRMGQYLLIGMWAGEGSAQVDPFQIVRKALRIVGTTYAAPHHYFEAMKLAEMYHKRFPLVNCVTHRFPLKDTVKAFDTITKGEAVKVVIEPSR